MGSMNFRVLIYSKEVITRGGTASQLNEKRKTAVPRECVSPEVASA